MNKDKKNYLVPINQGRITRPFKNNLSAERRQSSQELMSQENHPKGRQYNVQRNYEKHKSCTTDSTNLI